MAVIISEFYVNDLLDSYATFVGDDIYLDNCAHPEEALEGGYCAEASGYFFKRTPIKWDVIMFEDLPPYAQAWIILMGWKTKP